MSLDKWVYHHMPPKLLGDVLYPLNKLESIFPDAAASANKKYESREQLKAVRLPFLNCRWNDVLHLSPVHPTKIKEALFETGCVSGDLQVRKFFRLPVDLLESGKTLYFRNSYEPTERYDFLETDFAHFDKELYRELRDVPDRQRQYFLKMKETGGRPLLWARTPHVFYMGEISIKDVEVIEW